MGVTFSGSATSTTNGANTVITFTGNGSLIVSGTVVSEVFLVAGGGGGSAGGGGGGGLQDVTSFTLPTGTTTVTVGIGGAGGPNASTIGGNGGNTTFSTITAIGGGGGGNIFANGAGGGCGGGGGAHGSGTQTGGTGSQGGNGSNNVGSDGGGGGGTSASATSPIGGAGTSSSITGTSVTYGGGGGGGGGGSSAGSGGVGGGGQGYDNSQNGGNGTNGLGGGGGGTGSSFNGGNGGSGVAIFTFVTPSGGSSPTTYFISNEGIDSANGTTTSSSWATVNKVNGVTLHPGDQVLFKGGETFSSANVLILAQSGNSMAQIYFGSYGTGKATLITNSGGFYAYNNCQYYTVDNLIFQGNNVGAGHNPSNIGIWFNNSVANSTLNGIRFTNLDVSLFQGDGCDVEAGDSGVDNSGFTNLYFANCNFHDNLGSGWQSYSDYQQGGYGIFNLTLLNINCYNNSGAANTGGSGLVVGSVSGGSGMFIRCSNNGSSTTIIGPVGLWAYDSQNFQFSFCESHHNHRLSGSDGGGLDIDGGCSNVGFLYCYSHDNDGTGLQTYQYSGAPTSANNYYGFCISQNDSAATSTEAAILIGSSSGGGGSVTYFNCTVFNNNANVPIILQLGSYNATFYNNIFYANNNYQFFSTDLGGSGPPTNVNFYGNDYYGSGVWYYSGTTYSNFSQWQGNTAQEKISGTNVGLTVNPLLVNPGGGGNTGAYAPGNLTAYRLSRSSPMLNVGLNLQTQFGFNPGGYDYYGIMIPYSGYFNIGCSTALLNAFPLMMMGL